MKEEHKLKTIVHITTIHHRYDNRIFWKECRSLANDGYDVTLLVNDEQEDEVRDRISIVSIRKTSRNFLSRVLILPHYIKAIKKIRPDIVHFHDPEVLLIASRLKKYANVVIFDSHEYYKIQILTKARIPRLLRRPISEVYSLIETFVLKQIDGIIIPCTFNGINPFTQKAKHTEIIANKPYYLNYEIHHQYKYDMVYVGSISGDRGIFHYINLAIKTGDSLLVIGDITDLKLENKIKLAVQAAKNISFIKWVDTKELNSYLIQCKVGLCLIDNSGQYHMVDTLPTKVFDYFSFRMPVLLHKTNYNIGLLQNSKIAELVNYKDFGEILKGYLNLKKKLINEEIKTIFFDDFLSQNNWEFEYKKLKDFYYSLLMKY